jgi:hypothetical protein
MENPSDAFAVHLFGTPDYQWKKLLQVAAQRNRPSRTQKSSGHTTPNNKIHHEIQ